MFNKVYKQQFFAVFIINIVIKLKLIFNKSQNSRIIKLVWRGLKQKGKTVIVHSTMLPTSKCLSNINFSLVASVVQTVHFRYTYMRHFTNTGFKLLFDERLTIKIIITKKKCYHWLRRVKVIFDNVNISVECGTCNKNNLCLKDQTIFNHLVNQTLFWNKLSFLNDCRRSKLKRLEHRLSNFKRLSNSFNF